jgi:hypothetical protein
MATPATIDIHSLNRTLLARQHLFARVRMQPKDMVGHLCGMQAQAPQAPYAGLWSRIAYFNPGATGQLVALPCLVPLPLIRATLHLPTAGDALASRPVLQPSISRVMYQSSPYGRAIEGLDVDDLIAAGRAVVEAEPVIVSKLGRSLLRRSPSTVLSPQVRFSTRSRLAVPVRR